MLPLVAHHASLVTALTRGVDVLALLSLIVLFPIPFFWSLIHPAIHFWRRFGNRSYWIALPLWVTFGTVFLLLRGQLFAERFPRNALTWFLGAVLLILANWIERHTRQEFGFRRLAGLPEMNPGHRLSGVVRTGIYAYVRHPRYLEYMLTLLGLAFLTGAVGIFLLAIINVLLYQIVAPLEERQLLDRYGPQYEAYARPVPRFMPRLWRKSGPRISS